MIKVKNGRMRLVTNKSRLVVTMATTIILSALIVPTYISNFMTNELHWAYRILRYTIAFAVLAVFLRHGKLNKLTRDIAILEAFLFLSTLLHGSDLQGWVRTGAFSVVLMLYIQMAMKKDPESFIRSMSIVLGIYVHINTAMWILYPNGLYIDVAGYKNCWFLGYDNCAATIIILAEIMVLYHMAFTKNWFSLWNWSILISGSIFIFSQMVGSAIIAQTAALLFLLLTQNGAIRKVIGSCRLIVIGMLIVFFMLQFFSMQFRPLLSMLFLLIGKDITFSGRTRVWEIAWKSLLPQNIILGMGEQISTEYAARFGVQWGVHLHCYYLQVIYDGGLLAFGALVFLLLQVAKQFDKGDKDYSDMVLLAGLLAFMAVWQVEAYNELVMYFFALLALLYNAPMVKHRKKRQCRPAHINK